MRFKNCIFVLAGCVFLTLAIGCGPKKGGAAGAMGGFATSVVAQPVKAKKIEEKISLVGNLQADESIEIKNQIAGVIAQIGFLEGEPVKQGQTLFVIDADKLKASLAQALANLGLAQTTFARLSTLIKANAISQQEFDQASSDLEARKAQVELINAQLKETQITASFDGVTGDRKVSIGQFVNQGTLLTTLIKQDPMKAEFNIPERFLGQLKEAQGIEVTVAAYPDEIFKGEVYFIDPQVDELNRTALIKAKIPNPDGKLVRGMFANLNLIVSIRSEALVVPETALIMKSDDVFVFTVDSDNKAQMKKVKVGLRMVAEAEILEGLTQGENVIVEGYQKIGPGSLVNISETKSETNSIK
jgi:membrane fusion protein (multidrug efflux system)